MHMVTPRLMDAQRGSSSPQSQHTWLPGPLRATSSAAGLWAAVAPEDASPPAGGGGSSLGCKQLESMSHQEDQPPSGWWLRTLKMDITDSEQSKHPLPFYNTYHYLRCKNNKNSNVPVLTRFNGNKPQI